MTATPRHKAELPRKVAKNSGLMMSTLIRCIASTPAAVGNCCSARMTTMEKAKSKPEMTPQLTMAAITRVLQMLRHVAVSSFTRTV